MFYINKQGVGRRVSKKVTWKLHFYSYIKEEGISNSVLLLQNDQKHWSALGRCIMMVHSYTFGKTEVIHFIYPSAI